MEAATITNFLLLTLILMQPISEEEREKLPGTFILLGLMGLVWWLFLK